jgi:hypothetical protein
VELEPELRLRLLREPADELRAEQLQEPVVLLRAMHPSVEAGGEGDALDPDLARGGRPDRRLALPGARKAPQARDEADRLTDTRLDDAPGRLLVARRTQVLDASLHGCGA